MAKRRIIAHVLARVCFPYNRFCGFILVQRVKSRRCFIQIERLTLFKSREPRSATDLRRF
jgi:hypothetical protein